MSHFLFTFLLALLTSLVLAPFLAAIARRFSLVDHPDGGRKQHFRPVPLIGGPTLLLGAGLAITTTLAAFPDVLRESKGDRAFLVCLGVSALLLAAVGVLDDRFGLRGRQKLLLQTLACLCMAPSGFLIEEVSLLGYTLDFGDTAILVTLFWLLGAINSLNLIDGADGVASTVGAVMAITTAAIAWTVEARPDGMLVSLALAGGLIGFLFHNLPPAKMFLGDSGSMVAGLILGAITIKCSIKEASAIALLMPLAVWTVPIFDSSMAIVRRKLTGRSIYATDRNHLHHCLLRSGHDNVRVLLVIGTLCSISGGAAVLTAYFNKDGFAIAGAVSSIILLIVTKSFGFVEAKLILRRAARFARSLTIFSPGGDKPTFSEAISLHGVQDWAGLFAGLESTLIDMDLAFVELSINIPAVNEDWHGHSTSKNIVDNLDLHRLTFPLKVSGQTVGTLRIHAAASSYPSPAKFLTALHSNVDVFENKLNAIIRPILEAAAVSETSKLREIPVDQPPQAAHP